MEVPRSEVEGKIAAVRSALHSGTTDTRRPSTTELGESMLKIGQAVSGAQGGENGAGPDVGADGEAGAAEEGEVREV